MILATERQIDTSRLSKLDLGSSKELTEYSGFADDSDFSGQARGVFSLLLDKQDLEHIQQVAQRIFEILKKDIGNPLLPAFDYVRFDAFYDPQTKKTDVIEINTRNAGMHEIVEWLDWLVADHLSLPTPQPLNAAIALNQKKLLTLAQGESQELLFLSKSELPRWLYFDALKAVYKSVVDCSDPELVSFKRGLSLQGNKYTHIVKKMMPGLPPEYIKQREKGVFSVMQPTWMKKYGRKDFLESISDEFFIPASKVFDSSKIDYYVRNKDKLVLKIVNLGGSKSVFLGKSLTSTEWNSALSSAADKPSSWIIQEYVDPPECNVQLIGGRQTKAKVQLGVFIVPDANDDSAFLLDVVVKGYVGPKANILFDPSGYDNNILFGNVIFK